MQANKSHKINIIDFSTFEKIQQNEKVSRQIKNAKYRKKHKHDENNFDLVAWIALSHRQKGKKARAHYRKGATLLKQTCSIRKPGKISENRRKKLTRLKKSIMRYRELKHKKIENQPENVDLQRTSIQNSLILNNDLKEGNNSMEFLVSNQELFETEAHVKKSSDYINLIHAKNETETHTNLAVIADKFNNLTIHSRRFREYCDNCTTQDLVNLTKDILHDLNHFQRRAYSKNPVKANAHRRFVIGFREVQNNLKIKNKVKLILIATDCERCSSEGGIDEIIESIKSDCKTLEIPYAFSLNRRQMAYALHKKGIVSCVGVLDYDGVREKFAQFLSVLKSARQDFLAATKKLTP